MKLNQDTRYDFTQDTDERPLLINLDATGRAYVTIMPRDVDPSADFRIRLTCDQWDAVVEQARREGLI